MRYQQQDDTLIEIVNVQYESKLNDTCNMSQKYGKNVLFPAYRSSTEGNKNCSRVPNDQIYIYIYIYILKSNNSD